MSIVPGRLLEGRIEMADADKKYGWFGSILSGAACSA